LDNGDFFDAMLLYPNPLHDVIGFVLVAFGMVPQKLRKSTVVYGL
jgi:hypothetical protein